MRREKQEKSVSKTEERIRPQTGTPESTENKEVGARPRGKGGKIPPETEPTKKRKRENIEDGKKSGENGERKVRRKSEGGSEEGEEWGGEGSLTQKRQKKKERLGE